MKFKLSASFSSCLCSLLLIAPAIAVPPPAHVFLSDTDSTGPSPSAVSLSPSTARLIFAQRLGLSQFHKLDSPDDGTIQALNEFGGGPEKLFGGDEGRRRPKALFIVEGVEKIADVITVKARSGILSFLIDNPPESSSNARLVEDFLAQAAAAPMDMSTYDLEHFSSELKGIFQAADLHTDGGIVNGLACARTASLERSSERNTVSYEVSATKIRSVITALFAKAKSAKWDISVVIMPPKVGGLFKRSTTSDWGAYALPSKNRAETSVEIASGRPDFLPNNFDHVETNVEDQTGPPSTINDTRGDLTAHVSWEVDAPINVMQSNYSSNSSGGAPLGILPACFSTFDACVSVTYNCSGHGACKLKYRDVNGGNAPPCYSCQCGITRRTNEDGSYKTIQWAGPACQKNDVSTPFWLLGGITVALVSIVAWAIGLLYTMGSQDLPSVIGAGVAGPRAK